MTASDKYGEPLDAREPRFELDGRCLYCLSRLPADQMCRCGASLGELERARLAMRLADLESDL